MHKKINLLTTLKSVYENAFSVIDIFCAYLCYCIKEIMAES
jgi:hypothetical protein